MLIIYKNYYMEYGMVSKTRISRTALLLLLVLSLLFTGVYSLPTVAKAESLYIKKVVSVVFDDSGSMSSSGSYRYEYANYAMQSFCGMLNSEDKLFITYMSKVNNDANYKGDEVDLSSANIQSSVNDIASHPAGGLTPYEAVETAYNRLMSVNDPNPNTQYWLVVITDGEFNSGIDTSGDRSALLTQKFEAYASSTMPNGTHPSVTFMAIGSGIARPTQNESKGLYVYTASDTDATDVQRTMTSIADKISGRTRLSSSDMQLVGGKTVRVSSAIPLLNIVAFAQGTDAKISEVKNSNGSRIEVSRSAVLEAKKSGNVILSGSTYLIGDSQSVISSGTYDITFDKDVRLEDITVLFEPALEAKVTFTVNGKPINDKSALADTHDGDKISVSCKIYEMGTNKEISPSLLPPDTEYTISIYENGTLTESASGENMLLSGYTLKQVETEIKASIEIKGFNPISYTAKFTPLEYVYVPTYTVSAEYASAVTSVKHDNIEANNELAVIFKFYTDGVLITSKDEVAALAPTLTTSLSGHGGAVEYTDDGRVIFTPNTADAPDGSSGSYNVSVTCSISNGATASKSYSILLADYAIVPVPTSESIIKTRFFDNKIGVSFYVTKDGVKLDKNAIEGSFTAAIGTAHLDKQLSVNVADDGTITVIPYSETERELNIFSWLFNCWYYWGLSESPVDVTLTHKFGSASASIAVVGEESDYINSNVIAPLIAEIIILILLVILGIYIYFVIDKPRYAKGAKLYCGNIRYDEDTLTHTLRDFAPVNLEKFNKIKRGNGRLKFKRDADVVNAAGVSIRATYGSAIICEMPFPWYRGRLVPIDTSIFGSKSPTPSDIAAYVSRMKRMSISEFATNDAVVSDTNRTMRSSYRNFQYFVVPASGGIKIIDGRRVIKSGKIFIYFIG